MGVSTPLPLDSVLTMLLIGVVANAVHILWRRAIAVTASGGVKRSV